MTTSGSPARWRGAVAAAAILAAVAAAFPSSDPDVFFHLAVGREIVATGGMPASEPFCAVSAGRPFINHEWLFDLALWGAHEAAGPWGVVGFKALLAGVLGALALLLARRCGARPGMALGVLSAFLPAVRDSLEARPHLLAYGLAAASLLLVTRAARDGAGLRAAPATLGRTGLLALVAAAWTNAHGSFPLALGVAGLWAVLPGDDGSRPDRRWRLASVAAVALATCATPWGPAVWGVVLHHFAPAYRDLVPEWKPPAWGEVPARDVLVLAIVAAAALPLAGREGRKRLGDAGLLLLFLVPAASSAKFLLGLVVGAVPVAAAHLSRSLGRAGDGLPVAVGVAAGVAASIGVPPGWRTGGPFDLREQPVSAVQAAREAGLDGTVLAPFHVGGYVEYEAWPAWRPLLDGRAYVHGLEGIREYLGALADPARFREVAARYGVRLVAADLLDPSFPRLISALASDPGWGMAWLDGRFVLFAPTEVLAAKGIEPFRALRPSPDPRPLFDLPEGAVGRAAAEAARILARLPDDPLARMARAVLALRSAGLGWAPADALRDPTDPAPCRLAGQDLGRLAELRPDVPMYPYFLAVARGCAGDCPGALQAAREAGGFPGAGELRRGLETGRCR